MVGSQGAMSAAKTKSAQEIHPAKRWQRREVKAQATAPPTTQPASNPAGYPPAAAVSTVPAHHTTSTTSTTSTTQPTAPVPEAVTARHKPPDKCPICLEGFEAAGAMPRTCRKCQNNFHQACLAEWAKKEQQIKWEQKPLDVAITIRLGHLSVLSFLQGTRQVKEVEKIGRA